LHPLARIGSLLGIATLTALAPHVGGAAMHNHLLRAEPGIGGEVAGSPKELRLWFAQKPDPALTTIRLLGADSAAVPLGPVTPAESASVRAPIASALPPGKYVVRWKTAGDDGHVIRGSYSFTRKP
jgi:methionine-rich copper-binding protein CopC